MCHGWLLACWLARAGSGTLEVWRSGVLALELLLPLPGLGVPLGVPCSTLHPMLLPVVVVARGGATAAGPGARTPPQVLAARP